jgi:hypothetical protein
LFYLERYRNEHFISTLPCQSLIFYIEFKNEWMSFWWYQLQIDDPINYLNKISRTIQLVAAITIPDVLLGSIEICLLVCTIGFYDICIIHIIKGKIHLPSIRFGLSICCFTTNKSRRLLIMGLSAQYHLVSVFFLVTFTSFWALLIILLFSHLQGLNNRIRF